MRRARRGACASSRTRGGGRPSVAVGVGLALSGLVTGAIGMASCAGQNDTAGHTTTWNGSGGHSSTTTLPDAHSDAGGGGGGARSGRVKSGGLADCGPLDL